MKWVKCLLLLLFFFFTSLKVLQTAVNVANNKTNLTDLNKEVVETFLTV